MKRIRTEYILTTNLPENPYYEKISRRIFSTKKKLMKKINKIKEQHKGEWFHLWVRKVTYHKNNKRDCRWYGFLAANWEKQLLVIEHPTMKKNKRRTKEYNI